MVTYVVILLFSLPFMSENSLNDQLNDSQEIQGYVDSFKEVVQGTINPKLVDSVKITIKNFPSKDRAVGRCWMGKDRRIEVNKKAWETYGPLQQEALLFHELLHCACDMKHGHPYGAYKPDEVAPEDVSSRMARGFLEDGCPAVLGHPNVINGFCYEKHYEHYRYMARLQCSGMQIKN